jgi:FkbM family methyltransferase
MLFRKYTYYLSSVWKLMTALTPRLQVLRVFLHLNSDKFQTIEIRNSGLKFKTRGAMDIWSIKETFLDQFYEKFGTSIGDGWTVFDIGGGIGDFTIYVAAKHPTNVVYTFEPTPESFSLLKENLHSNNIKNVKVYPKAVWAQNEDLVLNTSQGEPAQYSSQPVESSSLSKENLIVRGISLQEAFDLTGLANCNLLKLDCEGAEYNILLNTPDKILNRIERIVLEYHENCNGYTHKDLVIFLKSKGFAVSVYPNYVHSYLGYLYASR